MLSRDLVKMSRDLTRLIPKRPTSLGETARRRSSCGSVDPDAETFEQQLAKVRGGEGQAFWKSQQN